MAKFYNKPYVWLEPGTTTSLIRIKSWDRFSRCISAESGYFTKQEEGETLFIIFRLHSGETGESNVEFDLNERSAPQYNVAVHNKVTIVITDEFETILGFHTIMPVMGKFEFTPGLLPPFMPFMWLQCLATDRSIVHIAALIPERAKISGPEVTNDPDHYQRIVDYKISGDTTSVPAIFHLEHYLDSSNNFDPVMENIIVNFIELDGSGARKKKGTGTVHTSEGDASGND